MLRAVANIPLYVGSFTYATLPAAASYSGMEAFASDWGANGTKVRSNGTRWLPMNGQTVLKRMGVAVSGIANVETIATQVQMPVGSLQAGDTIMLYASLSKSGTTDTLQLSFRVGTAGTTSDTAITGLSALSQMATTIISGGVIHGVRVLSTTSMQRIGVGANNNTSGYGSTSTTTTSVATTGLSDSSANALWLTLTVKSSSTTDTVGVQEVTLVHIAG